MHISLFIVNIVKKNVLKDRDNLTRRFVIFYNRQNKFEDFIKDYNRLLNLYNRLEFNNVTNQEKFKYLQFIVKECVRRKLSKKKATNNIANKKLKYKICYYRQIDASFLCDYILCMLYSKLIKQCLLKYNKES